jgi:hypothetical protein
MSENETQWHVQVEEGLVKIWSLDQLDAAFKAGLIDEATFVMEDGSSDWMTLGALLGGDEEEEAPPITQAPELAATVAVQPIPVAAPIPQSIEPMAQAYPPVVPSYVSTTPSYAPPSATPESLTPMSFSPQSSAMVGDLDDEMPFRRSSKKRGVVIGLSVVAVAAGVAFAALRSGSSPAADTTAVAAAAQAPAPVVASTPPSTTEPTPMSPTPQRLTDEQRRALANADKAMETKQSAMQKARASNAPKHHGKASHEKTPFHNGGEQGDPLNAKL